MFIRYLRDLLVAGLLASTSTTAEPLPSSSLKPLMPHDLDSALVSPVPGIRFIRPSHRSQASLTQKRSIKDRFRPTEHWSPITVHAAPRRAGRLTVPTAHRRVQQKHGGRGSYENITSTSAYGTQYGLAVAFPNKQRLVLALDTGSADTWVVSARANCSSTTTAGGYLQQSCGLGPAYTGGFNVVGGGVSGGQIPEGSGTSGSGGTLRDAHLYIEYGDGEVVQGPLGPVDVTLAGLRVRNQTVALANSTLRWAGGEGNVTSGVLGLAYPALTNAYGGAFGDHAPFLQEAYAPVFASMVGQGLVDKGFFSVAISREGPGGRAAGGGGAVAFGGVPGDLDGVDYGRTAVTDIIIANVIDNENTASDYSFYTIIPDGWLFNLASDSKKVPYIVDSGTSFIYLPSDIAAAINGAFDPPAEFSFLGGYYTTCDAIPPRVSVVIDGQPFWLSPRDLILREAESPLTGMCMTTVGDGGTGPYVLGDVFLKNVLAVFDVDDAVMQFAAREKY